MEKKKCKGCKNKSMIDLNKGEKEEERMPTLVKVLFILYTVLAGYGAVRLVLDLNTLLNNL